MSRLLDGELSPNDADQLHDYLERHPEAMDWMESNQLIHDSAMAGPSVDVDSAWQDIEPFLAPHKRSSRKFANLIRFPVLLQTLGYAAAFALFGTIAWTSLMRSPIATTERYAASGSIVEFVETEIPNASPIVYTDEISGWTVVWIAQMDPIPDETS